MSWGHSTAAMTVIQNVQTEVEQKCPSASIDQSFNIVGDLNIQRNKGCTFRQANEVKYSDSCTYNAIIREAQKLVAKQKNDVDVQGLFQLAAADTEATFKSKIANHFEQICSTPKSHQETTIGGNFNIRDNENCVNEFLNKYDGKTACAFDVLAKIAQDTDATQDASVSTAIGWPIVIFAAIIGLIIVSVLYFSGDTVTALATNRNFLIFLLVFTVLIVVAVMIYVLVRNKKQSDQKGRTAQQNEKR